LQDHRDRRADVVFSLRPHEAAVGADAQRKGQAAAEDAAHFLPFSPGTGKHMMKYGSQRKMKSNSVTMMISRISAQIVMMGIDSEQIIPMLTPPLLVHAPPSPTLRAWCSGQ